MHLLANHAAVALRNSRLVSDEKVLPMPNVSASNEGGEKECAVKTVS
jgi:hypothetical protein